MKSIDITIQDKEGLHARPAGILSKAAKGFESKVTMTKNGKVADMKKIFAVMGLAVKCGETVTIAADGPDEDAAIEELTKLCKDAPPRGYGSAARSRARSMSYPAPITGRIRTGGRFASSTARRLPSTSYRSGTCASPRRCAQPATSRC